jgi:hypothetical protein
MAKTDKKEKTAKKPLRISKETIVIILIIVVVFVAWNLLLPYIFKVQEVKNVTLPQVKRGNIEFVDKQIQNRTLQVPTLIPPENTLGKQNPFE